MATTEQLQNFKHKSQLLAQRVQGFQAELQQARALPALTAIAESQGRLVQMLGARGQGGHRLTLIDNRDVAKPGKFKGDEAHYLK